MNELIEGPAGQIELDWEVQADAPAIGVICHPHSQEGGTMNNKVVTTVARAFHAASFGSVRFNFRGVGQSSGAFANGEGEAEDLACVLAWVQEKFPNADLYLAGFSFGSYVAYRTAPFWPLKKLICIAPAVEHYSFSELPGPECPCLVIQGEADEVSRVEFVLVLQLEQRLVDRDRRVRDWRQSART